MSMHDVWHGVRLHTLLEGNLGEQGSCGKLMHMAVLSMKLSTEKLRGWKYLRVSIEVDGRVTHCLPWRQAVQCGMLRSLRMPSTLHSAFTCS